jgi:hypothetical protein
MTPDDLKRLTHSVFLNLYYRTPLLRGNSAISVPIGRHRLTIKEPADAIVLLLEILSDSGGGFCFQGDLEDRVRQWYGVETSSSFDKSLAILDNLHCVTKQRNPSNKRQNKLELTAHGRQLAARIRTDRVQALAPLMEALGDCAPPLREQLGNALTDLLHTIQPQVGVSAIGSTSKKR